MSEDQTKVAVSLEEYKDFVIYEHEQGKLKKGLTQEVNELKEQKHLLLKEQEELLAEAQKLKDSALEMLFRRERMGSDDRQDQTSWHSSYFGFDPYKRDYLTQELGYTQEQLIAFINAQWDEREKNDKGDE